MTSTIEKKELNEPDKLQLIFLTATALIKKQIKFVYIGAGILAVIIMLAGGWFIYSGTYEKGAEKLYSEVYQALQKAGSPAGDQAAIKGYKELITRYPRSKSAVSARYRLGNIYFSGQQIDASIVAYQDFLNKSSTESDLVALAYNGLGSCYYIKKDFNKAIESFDMAIKKDKSLSFEAMNYGSMAMVYEAMNNAAKAVEFYKKALGKTTDPMMTLYLKRKIAALG
jgi:tetratricopeptide (TPR) repeat protein